MLINFSVQNFGSIKDKQTLSFVADKSTHLEDYYIINAGGMRLLKLGLIYGANASGKTTVLKALDFLRVIATEPLENKTESLDFKPFLFDFDTPKQNTKLSIEFIRNEVRYFYEVELNQQAIIQEELYYYPNKVNVFKRTTDLEKQLSEITFGNKIKISKTTTDVLKANTLSNNTVLGGFLKTNMESSELKDVTDWFRGCLFPIIRTRYSWHSPIFTEFDRSIDKNIVINILKKADFNISDILIKEEVNPNNFTFSLKNDPTIHTKKEKVVKEKKIEFEHIVNMRKYALSFSDESQGTQIYYELGCLLSVLIKGLITLPIDELESSLHPDLYTHFLLTFLVNSEKSQIIATTHNREILNNKDIFRNDAIWFTEKTEDSATELYSLADFDTSVIRDTSNIYNAYRIGKLGGVPNLGDYYIDLDDETAE